MLNIKNIIYKCTKEVPATAISLIIFFSNQFFFGIENAIMGPYMTIAFRKGVNKFHKINEYFKDLFIHFFIVMSAFIATKNLSLCILINLVVCFILIYTLTDEYNHTGYFHYVMAFIMLQAFPTTLDKLPLRLLAIIYSNSIVYIGFIFFSPKRIYCKFNNLIFSGINIIKNELGLLLDKQYHKIPEEQEKLFEVNKGISNLIYENRSKNYFTIVSGQGYFPFSSLFQHFNIFIDEFINNKNLLEKKEHRDCLEKLIYILENIPEKFYCGNNEEYIKELILFSSKYSIDNISVNNYFIYIVNLLASILDFFSEDFVHKGNLLNKEWKVPNKSKPIGRLVEHFSFNSFKLRFALRSSIIVTLGFVLEEILNLPKGYWLPLNIFVLVIPFYEKSITKAINRLKGTLIGIFVSFLLFTVFKTKTEHVIIMALSNLLLYSMNNYVIVCIYVTCSAVSIASLHMKTEELLLLRFLYVLVAAFISIVANSFIFKSNISTEILNSFNKLIRLDKVLICEINNILNGSKNSSIIREVLLKVNLISKKIQSYYNDININIDIKKYLLVNSKFIIEIEHLIDIIETIDKNRINKEEFCILINNMNRIFDIIENTVNNTPPPNYTPLEPINKNSKICDSPYICESLNRCIDKINELYYLSLENLYV